MSDGDTRPDASFERIDADAVCEQCGTVNPEDTLLCKTCGNNLRDQRLRRIAGEQRPEGLRPARSSWIRGLLVVLAILFLLWVAMNVGRIEDFLMNVQMRPMGDAEAFWSGSLGRVFDQLAADLRANPTTPQQSAQAVSQPVVSDTYDGRYILVSRSLTRQIPVGEANVRVEGDVLRFVAVLPNRDIEVRGAARSEGNARIAARDSAGARINGRYYGVSGFAQKADTGGFECLGLCDYGGDESYSVLAFRVPE
jgi:ribosomal protein L40E